MSLLDDAVTLLPLARLIPLLDQERNIALIPEGPPPSVRPHPLAHPDAGPPGGEGPPQRVVAVLGPGATFAGLADTLAPVYAAAASKGGPAAPPPDELARGLAVYAEDYLPHYTVGLILPLPVEIDAASGEWTVDADLIHDRSMIFPPAKRTLLHAPPAALPVPDALDLESAAAALAARLSAADLAAQLWTRALRNPSEAVLAFLAALRALDRAAPGQAAVAALAALSAATQAQLSVLAATRAGNGILRRLAAGVASPPADADPGQVARAKALLDGALRPGGTLVPHRDVPQALGQLAERKGTARGVDGAAADPPGGLHQLVFGRDIAVGRLDSTRVNGQTYTGPAFEGRVALRPYLEADRASLTTDPALVTLLANSSDPGQKDHVQRLDAVRAHDPGLLAAGLDQWAATAELPALLDAYKAAAPDEFDLFFALHGLDVRPGPAHQLVLLGPDGNGTVPTADQLRAFFGGTTDAQGGVTFSAEWAARFRLPALVSAAYRRAQVAQAAQRIAAAASPLTLLAASFGPFPAGKYQLALDTGQSSILSDSLLTPLMNSVLERAAAAHGNDAGTLAAAVVDLTGGPSVPPPYAGFFADQTFNVGSMGKIGPMYAAHELRFRVQRLVTQVRNHSLDATPQWRQNLSQAIRDVWGPQVCRVFPDFPKLNVGQFPNLKVIFDIDANGAVSFLKGTEPDPDKAVHDVGELNPPTDKQAFDDWMRNMVLWSNNSAAGRVISALGYPYLNRLLRVAGFFNPDVKPGAGLWVSGNYATKTKDWEPGTDLLTLTARGQQHYKATTNFAATGQDVARLLAMAALRKLFDEDAQTCDDMVNLMSKPVPGGPAVPGGPGVKSFIRIALALGAPGTIGSKIGIGVPDPRGTVGVHDCAIVSRTAAGGTALRYVAVILGGYLTPGTADADSAFNDAVVAVDTSVLAMH